MEEKKQTEKEQQEEWKQEDYFSDGNDDFYDRLKDDGLLPARYGWKK